LSVLLITTAESYRRRPLSLWAKQDTDVKKYLKNMYILRTADNRLEATIARGRRFKEVRKKIIRRHQYN